MTTNIALLIFAAAVIVIALVVWAISSSHMKIGRSESVGVGVGSVGVGSVGDGSVGGGSTVGEAPFQSSINILGDQ